MGLRELLILVLILAIIAVVLRGLYVALRSRRNRIRMALDKNIPQYDLDEIEMRELPSGGARLVERSFAQAMQQSTAQNAREATAAQSDSPVADDQIPVLTEKVNETSGSSTVAAESAQDLAAESNPDPEPEPMTQRTEPVWEDDSGSLDAQIFVEDYASGDDEDDDYEGDDEDDYDDEDEDGDGIDDIDEESEDSLTRSSWLDEPDPAEEIGEDTDDDEVDDLDPDLATVQNDPQEDTRESFGAATDDDFDILLDGYDEERNQRLEQLEAQQEKASRKFASWAGQKMDSLSSGAGSLLRAGREKRAHSQEDKARLKEEKRSRLQEAARREEARQNELDLPVPEARGPEREHNEEQAHRHDTVPAAERSETPVAEPARDEEAAVNNNVDQEYSEVLVINVMAREGEQLHGDDMLPVLLSAGLRFGEMSIFHRHASGKSGPVLFSVANVLNPGTFDLNSISEFSTRGLCFFLTLPNVINNMQAFDEMLRTAHHICDGLDAELKDDNRSVMTAQTIEHYRERIRNFELRQLRGGR